jgi:hypothetical protein
METKITASGPVASNRKKVKGSSRTVAPAEDESSTNMGYMHFTFDYRSLIFHSCLALWISEDRPAVFCFSDANFGKPRVI